MTTLLWLIMMGEMQLLQGMTMVLQITATADKLPSRGPAPHGQKDKALVAYYWQQALKLQKRLLSICRAIFKGNSHDAEDAVQSALIKGAQKYPKHADRIKNFTAWLIGLTKNFCIDLINIRDKQATGVDDIELVNALGGIDRYSDDDTPVQMLVSDEEYAYIDDAIACLPDTLRETYSLHYYEELSNTEIADRQEITKDNVYQRISRAKKMLVAKLRGYFCPMDDTTLKFKIQNSELKIGNVPENKERSHGSNGPDTARQVTATDRARDSIKQFLFPNSQFPIGTGPEKEARSHGNHGHVTARQLRATDSDRSGESPKIILALTKLATRYSGNFGSDSETTGPSQFNIPYSQFKNGTGPENEVCTHGDHGHVAARRLGATDSDRGRECRKIIPRTMLLRGYRALTKLAKWLSGYFGSDSETTGLKQFKIKNSLFKIGTVPLSAVNKERWRGGHGLVTARQMTATARGREIPMKIPITIGLSRSH
ncbi:MAG: RNA polymerase sigma factor [Hormoscilla sp.]